MKDDKKEQELRQGMAFLKNQALRKQILDAIEDEKAIRDDPLYQAFMNQPVDHIVHRVVEGRVGEPTLVLGESAPQASMLERLSNIIGRYLCASLNVVDDLAFHLNGFGQPLPHLAGATDRSTRGGAQRTDETSDASIETLQAIVHGVTETGATPLPVTVEVLEPLRFVPAVDGFDLRGHFRVAAELGEGRWWWLLRFERTDEIQAAGRTLVVQAKRVDGVLEFCVNQRLNPSIPPSELCFAADEFDVELVLEEDDA